MIVNSQKNIWKNDLFSFFSKHNFIYYLYTLKIYLWRVCLIFVGKTYKAIYFQLYGTQCYIGLSPILILTTVISFKVRPSFFNIDKLLLNILLVKYVNTSGQIFTKMIVLNKISFFCLNIFLTKEIMINIYMSCLIM